MSFYQDDCAVYLHCNAILANACQMMLFDIKANGIDLLTDIYAVFAGVKYAIVKANYSYLEDKSELSLFCISVLA